MAFDGTLKFDTAIDKTGFQRGLSSLGGIAKAGMAAVTAAVTAAAGAVSALGGYAVRVGSRFEGSMAQVIATMGITKDTVQDGINSYDLLADAAAAAGESTVFSASEAADALNYLALAGYDAATAADALPAVLDLAAAGGLDLAYASDLATDAMAALGIEASKASLTAFGDQMAKTASKANTSVAQLGEAILTVGGTAKVLAGGTTELNAALGVLANRGIKGAEGGTHLRNMILSLSAPTNTARAALDNLGVSALDAEGNMRPLNDIFGDLSNSLAGMSDGDTAAILSDIFNKTDLASAQALLAGCGEEFESLMLEIGASEGAMAQMAETMNDTLEGDLKSLGSKAEAFGIAVYDGMNEPLRELAQLGIESVSQLTGAFTSGGFDGLAAALGDVFARAVTRLSAYLPKLVKIGASVITSLISGLKSNAPAILQAAFSAGQELLSGILSVLPEVIGLGGELIVQLADSIREAFADPATMAELADGIMQIADAFAGNFSVFSSCAADIVKTLAGGLSAALPDLVPQAVRIIGEIAETLTDPDTQSALLDAALGIITSLSEGLLNSLGPLLESAPVLIQNLCAGLADAIPKLFEAAVNILAGLVDFITDPDNLAMLAASGLDILLALIGGVGDCIWRLFEIADDIISEIAEDLNLTEAYEWGKDLIGNFISGAKAMIVDSEWGNFWQDIGEDIYDVLHHSTPEKGPLKDDDKWGGDLMQNFIDGIGSRQADLAGAAEAAAASVADGLSDIPDLGEAAAQALAEVQNAMPVLEFPAIQPEPPDIPDLGEAAAQALNEVRLPELTISVAKPEIPGIELPDDAALEVFRRMTYAAEEPAAVPSATSEIVSNQYSYSTISNASPEENDPPAPVYHFTLAIDGEDVAEAAAVRLDEIQGETIQLRKRGLAK